MPPPPARAFTLGILAVDGCMAASVASAADALLVAQTLAELRTPGRAPQLRSVVFGARGQRQVRSASGLDLAGLVEPPEVPDVVLLPGLAHSSAGGLLASLHALQPEQELLRAYAARGVVLAGACSGAFQLAEAGLLEGHRATTSWWLAAAFRARYPQVRLEADAMLVEDRAMITSGGSTGVLGLMLRLIARAGGDELAQQTSRMLVIDPDRQSQAPYVSLAMLQVPRSSMTERAESFLRQSLHTDVSVSALAQHCGTSERSLLRHFRTQFGTTPVAHMQHLRVERAKALLETSLLTFDEIVERCGYSDVSSFRRLFKRATTLTPGGYRERFRLRPH